MLEFVDRGKILIGIGNGFRVLCETGLVPGIPENEQVPAFCLPEHLYKT